MTTEIDLSKPLTVSIVSGPIIGHYYAKLLPSYTKDPLKSVRIYKDKQIFGFMKFDPENPLASKDFIISNFLHSFCEEFLGKNECRCYQGEEKNGDD